MNKGYLCLVLHTHLPYVRHPEYENFLEEDWLYEAITETYIPLLDVFQRLVNDGIDFRVTMSLSPSLLSMLTDSLLQSRYLRHIDKLIELAHKEVERTRFEPDFHKLAIMYLERFNMCRATFVSYGNDLTKAFKKFQDLGKVEIITCSATHSYLPLMGVSASSKKAQIRTAVRHYEKIFGLPPRGIWLPECGYNPGDDFLLKEAGLKYFFTDAHGILHATPRPKYGVFAPIYCRGSNVACFGRDLESSKQVWSSIEGYPGDHNYREFYRDIGFDLDYDYVRGYISPDGIRKNTGIKYFRISGNGDDKKPYVAAVARQKAADHAGNFIFNRHRQVEFLYELLGKKPIIVSPYDTELFGHWWFEGPMWLEFLIRKLYYDQSMVRMINPMEYLQENPLNQVVSPSMSSWGYKGYSEMWLQGANDWIYRHLHEASLKMDELVKAHADADGLVKRSLNQSLRELLLAQGSDWAFIMGTGTHTNYAVKRTKDHLLRFSKLYEDIKSGAIDENWLADIESKDNIFPEIDYRVHQ